MSTSSDYTSYKHWVLSGASVQSAQVTGAPCDLLTFLGFAQKLHIAILPITWQTLRLPIGRGAMGKINETLINPRTSFVFKCATDKQKEDSQRNDGTEARIISAFINEIIVYGHASEWSHPNIVELQGICWDIAPNDKIWPVLVFEKTHYGDLHSFISQFSQRKLYVTLRKKLCVDVGRAISHMHSNGK